MDSATNRLPPHLDALLQATPTGVTKLLAAWDGLCTETQIDIISRIPANRYPAYLAEKIRAKALKSTNPYVRYLAYRGVYLGKDDPDAQEVKARIEADPDPLVRYSTLEREWSIIDPELKNPEKFLALPHEARLAKVRELKGNGEDIARIIAYGVENHLKDGKISEIEIYEVLADYLVKPSFRKHYARDHWTDGGAAYSAGRDISALWQLVTKTTPVSAHLLVETLPQGAGLQPRIPQNVLNGLNEDQLETLLRRDDIDLTDFRKNLFNRPGVKHLDGVRCAAVSSNFSLDNAEFAAVLALPEEERVGTLRDLAVFATDLRLCLYDAINDILTSTEVVNAWEASWDAESARNAMERKLKQLSGWRREHEIRELRIYRLARQAVPFNSGQTPHRPSNELEFLVEHIADGDTWATFAAFEEAWNKNHPKAKRLERHLPRIYGIDDDLDVDLRTVEQPSELAARVEEKLKEVLSAVSTKSSDDRQTGIAEALSKVATHITIFQERAREMLTEMLARVSVKSGNGREPAITEALKAVSTHLSSSQERTTEGISVLNTSITALQADNRRLRGILYVVVVLLLIAAWRMK